MANKTKLLESCLLLQENDTILEASFYNTKYMVKPIKRNVPMSKLTKSVYIILTNTKTTMGKAIKVFTGSEYNHASIALDSTFNNVYGFGRNVDSDESGFIVEQMGGGFYRDNDADYLQLRLPVTESEYKKIQSNIQKFEKQKTKFNFNKLGLIMNALNIPRNSRYEFFCSQFIAYVLNKSGVKLFNKDYGLVRPNDFRIHPDLQEVSSGRVVDKAKKDKKMAMKESWDDFLC